MLFYLVAYGAMTLGAFGVLALLNCTGSRSNASTTWPAWARRIPGLAL